jgi:thiol-disulfide isomerase/thioredoxin
MATFLGPSLKVFCFLFFGKLSLGRLSQRRLDVRDKETRLFSGPENLVYFRANGLDEELERDPHVTWIVAFFAPWSPSCINFTPIFSKLSGKYHLPNLKFGKKNHEKEPGANSL